MPVKECTKDGRPGYKYGEGGYCFTYLPGNAESRKSAELKAVFQGSSIESHRKAKE